MPEIRVSLSRESHNQLKIIAIGLDTTLSGVVVQACERYIDLVGIRSPKAKPSRKTVPSMDSRKRT